MNAFFEFIYQDQHYISFDHPREGMELSAYHYMPGYLQEVMAATGYSFARYKERIVDGTPCRLFTAEMLAETRLLPPLMPPMKTCAVISGFGLSNRGKVAMSGNTPAPQPSWFFKGTGPALKVNGDRIAVSATAISICEEAEIVLVYMNDQSGTPRYIGFTVGNDLTDMGTIKSSPQGFSYGKLCECAVHQTLFIEPPPQRLTGHSAIYRDGALAWEGKFSTGTEELYYPITQMLGNLFQHPSFQLPGMVNYVYIGADRNSYDAGFRTRAGDRFELEFKELGITVKNELVFKLPQPAPASRSPSEKQRNAQLQPVA